MLFTAPIRLPGPKPPRRPAPQELSTTPIVLFILYPSSSKEVRTNQTSQTGAPQGQTILYSSQGPHNRHARRLPNLRILPGPEIPPDSPVPSTVAHAVHDLQLQCGCLLPQLRRHRLLEPHAAPTCRPRRLGAVCLRRHLRVHGGLWRLVFLGPR